MDLFDDAANGFHLYHGNDLERLAGMLSSRLGKSRDDDPLNSDRIVVQSRGMGRWLNMALAGASGVAANISFPFPRGFFEEYVYAPLARQSGGNIADFAFFAPENLTWKLAALIPGMLSEPEFQVLQKYLSGDNRNLKLIQLAERVAGLFDQYMTYRPDLINAWDRGGNPLEGVADSRWQYRLWQQATADNYRQHPAFYYQAFLEQVYPELYPAEKRVYRHQADFRGLRELQRVFFFGFSSIAPVYLDIIFAMSRLLKVDFYYLNPCAEYWEYNRPYRQLLQESGKKRRTRVESAEAKSSGDYEMLCGESAFECANPLLGAWGEQGREFFALVNSANPTGEEALFELADAEGALNLLQQLRADITNLTVTPAVRDFDQADGSIQFHSCHSKMREVEVLRENLLHFFVTRPGLQPEDVLVLTPDINAYAPYIEAVFNTVNPESPKWFYATIADRDSSGARPEVGAWLRMLTLDRERFNVSAVLDLLEIAAVRRRCGLEDGDLDRIRLWLKDTGVNWGIDGTYHQEKSGFEFPQNSWRFGLQRMLGGFAMMPEPQRGLGCWETADGDILPYDNIEGDSASQLGKLCDFFDRLTMLHRQIRQYETVGGTAEEWYALLGRTVDDFLSADKENVDGIQAIRDAVGSWFDAVSVGGGNTGAIRFDLAGILYCLRQRLDGDVSAGGFLQGGVTFCQARPLRSIPARVICMLGMDDGAFPRQDRRPSFDLMAAKPRLGDRSSRNDDRYLFLETLLSAREVFYISFVGQNIKENTTLPPSVPVCELLDYLVANYLRSGTADQLLVRHPLQAFSRRYFDATERDRQRLFSYSEENCRALAALSAAKGTRDEMTRTPMSCFSPLPEELRCISLRELADFLKNPAKAFCRNRLGIDITLRDAAQSEDREPFTLSPLDKYRMGEEILLHGLTVSGGNSGATESLMRNFLASGRLPVGAQGAIEFQRFEQEFRPLFEQSRLMVAAPLPTVSVALLFPELEMTLEITMDSLYVCRDGKKRQIFFRLGEPRPCDVVQAELYHLALALPEVQSAMESDPVLETILMSQSGIHTRSDIFSGEQTMEKLCRLLQLYLDGMARPLEFEPAAAQAFWKALSAGNPEEAALEKAAAAWPKSDSEYVRYDEFIRFCFGDHMPSDQDFMTGFIRCCKAIYDVFPLLPGGKR